MKKKKLLEKLLSGTRNVRFSEVVSVAESFGFRLDRVSGSHHIFVHPEIPELLNLQEVKGKAKPYQIRQLLQLVEKHDLRMEKKP
jgi:predicted RNA binding protein YcfA (HicA-like mRNA interferase family)